MAHVRVADYIVLSSGFTLPSTRTAGGNVHIRGDEVISFDLPADILGYGILSFAFTTDKGVDDGIDVTFKISIGAVERSWWFKQFQFTGLQIPVKGLKPGNNYVTFETLKAGTVTAPDPDEYLGGKGVVHFEDIILTFLRNELA
jgi:hypothetical protein